MQVSVVGVNHSSTPVDVRERLAVSASDLAAVLSSLQEEVPEAVLLSTCNRTEVYTLDQGGGTSVNAAVQFLCARSRLGEAELRPYLYIHENKGAVQHLFRVASGLDSMIVGEYEILGQVKEALEAAEKTGQVGVPLLNLFHHAVRVGRRVRHETGLSRHALSVSSVAVELATKVVGPLGACQILVVGAGEAGRLVAKAARMRGASHIVVTSRSQEHASALAAMLGGHAVALSDLASALGNADIVITCTGAPYAILSRQMVEEAMRQRPDRPLVVVDIAVPRNAEPGVREVGNVFLFDIDDLTHSAQLNRERRRSEMQRASEIVDAEVDKYMTWWQALEVKPVIRALVQKAEAVRQAQLKRALKELPTLSEQERQGLEAMTRALMRKMLHDPINYLKQNSHDNELYLQVVQELFRLDREQAG